MATDFSVQLRGVEGVASADPSTAMRAEQMRGQVVSQAIGVGAETIFDAYKGFKEEEVRQDVQQGYDNLKFEMDAIKDAEQRNNLLSQTTERTPAAVKAFEAEQKRIGEAILQMPERAAEWRMRSSKALREAIAKTPGMANTFRQVAQQVTGIKDLDMYSVTNLYDEIDMVAKRQQQAQQAAAKADEEARKAFVKDVGNTMSETEANAAFASMTPTQRLQIASDAFKTDQRKKAWADSLKAGGNAVENGVTNLIAGLDTGNVSMMNSILVKLREVGIDEATMASGKLTEAQKANPKLPVLLAEASAIHKKYIDDGYQQGLAQLQAALQSGVVDSTAGRNARSDLEKWHQSSIEKLNKYGASALLSALASADEADPQKTLDVRLRTINLISDSLDIPPEVATQFAAGDKKRNDIIRTQYPQWGAAFDHMEELRKAALRGVPNQDWFNLIRKGSEIKAAPTVSIPQNNVERTANVIAVEDSLKKVRDTAALGTPDTPSTLKVLSGGFAMRDAGEKVLKEYSKAIEQQVRLVPQGEKGAFNEQVTKAFETAVFGSVGHGDVAWTRLQSFRPGVTEDFAQGARPVFIDATGATPLQMQTLAVGKRNLTPEQQMALERYNLGEDKPKEVNAALASVDTAIRVRSLVTGEDVRVLRKEFMDTFMKGKPSEVYTSAASGYSIAAAQSKGGAQQPPSSPAPVGTLNKESQLKGAVSSGLEDLQRELTKEKAMLEDIKPGSRLYAMTQENIRALEEEIKRNSK